jgi:integrase
MTAFMHATGKWCYEFVHKKKRHCGYGFKNKRHALTEEKSHRERLVKIKADITFCDLCTLYLEHSNAFNSAEWAKTKKWILEKYFKKWEPLLVRKIDKEMVENHMIERKKQVSALTANRDFDILNTMFNFAVEREYLDINPCRRIRKLPQVQKKRMYLPSREDILKVMHATTPQRRAMIVLQQSLAARSREINLMRWSDVNLTERTVTLWTRKSKGGNERERTLFLNNDAYAVMQKLYSDKAPDSEFVFVNPRTKRTYTDKHWLKKVCRRAGVTPFGTHALRHYAATVLKYAGVPTPAIQSILGHTQISTTDIYLHLMDDNMEKHMQKLDGLTT